jgi:hypothetical protein
VLDGAGRGHRAARRGRGWRGRAPHVDGSGKIRRGDDGGAEQQAAGEGAETAMASVDHDILLLAVMTIVSRRAG